MIFYNILDTFYRYDIKHFKKIEFQAYQLLRLNIDKINAFNSKYLIAKFYDFMKKQHFFYCPSIKCQINHSSYQESIDTISLAHFKNFLIIGRSRDSDLRLTSSKVSNHHAKIHVDEYLEMYIEDLGSANGSFLNGTRIVPDSIIRITHKDNIRIGDYSIFFKIDFTATNPRDILTENIEISYCENDIFPSSGYNYFFNIELSIISLNAIFEIEYNFINYIINRMIGIRGYSELIPEVPGKLETNIVAWLVHRLIAELNKDPSFKGWGPISLTQTMNPLVQSNDTSCYRLKKYFRIKYPLNFDGLNTIIYVWIPSYASINIVEKLGSLPQCILPINKTIINNQLFENTEIDVIFRLTSIFVNYAIIEKLEKSYIILPKNKLWDLDCNNYLSGQIHMAINPDKFWGGVFCTCRSMGNTYNIIVQKIEKGDWELMKEYNYTHNSQDVSNESTCPIDNPNQQILSAIELQIIIELGRIRIPLKQILTLKEGDIFALNKRIDDSLDLYIGNHKLGSGKLVRIEDSIGIEVLSICEKKK